MGVGTVATGIGAIGAALLGDGGLSTAYFVTVVLLIPMAYVDLRFGIIPDVILLCGSITAVALHVWAAAGVDRLWYEAATITSVTAEIIAPALVGAAAGYGIRRLGIWLFKRPGFGIGDIKLFFVLGLLLGYPAIGLVYLAVCTAGIAGLVGILFGKLDRRRKIPFAPFVLLAAVPYPFLAPWIESWL